MTDTRPPVLSCRVPNAVNRAARAVAKRQGLAINAFMAKAIRAAIEQAESVELEVERQSPPAFILPTRDHAKRVADNTAYARHIEETGSQRLSGRMHAEPRALKPTHAQTAQRKPAFKD